MAIVSKLLQKTDMVSGNHRVDLVAKDESGQVWTLRICTHKKNKFLKPVLTKGWREFVCSKELKVGDRVVFYKMNEQAGAVKYRVEVEKAVQIFGAGFDHKPIHSDTNPVQNQETILSTRDQGRHKRGSKELRVGDRVVFYEENEQASAVKCRVEVKKAVKILAWFFPHKKIHGL